MRKLLLLLLACVSSSMLLAQTHYQPNTGIGDMTMDGKCVIRIDGQEELFESYELGVFLASNPEDCRGAALVNTMYYQYFNHYLYIITIYGESNEEMTFRLFDHATNQELPLTTTATFTFVQNGELGTYYEPYFIDFTTPAPQPTTYELYIPGYGADDTGGYYLIASPVTVAPAEVTGDPQGMTEGNFDLYYFDNSQELEWINYTMDENGTVNPNFGNLVPGKGFLYAREESTELQFSGEPYEGNGEFDLSYSAGNQSMGGWNLMGNPYDYNVTINKENFYVMNEDGDDIIVANGSTPITPMQGFFVLATREGESVTISEYQAPIVPFLDGVVLNLSRNRGNTIDRAIVRLGEGSTLPKFMLNPNNTKIYIEQDGDDYAVVSSTANEMPISFKASSNGTYTLNVAVENTEMQYLHLIDNIAGIDTDLLANPSYTFEAHTNDYACRFTLVMNSTTGLEEQFAFFNGHNWTVSNEGQATLQVIDMTGRLISTTTIDGTSQLDVNAATGVYMFRLINGNDVKVQKVIIK